jgi:hypothetical protein
MHTTGTYSGGFLYFQYCAGSVKKRRFFLAVYVQQIWITRMPRDALPDMQPVIYPSINGRLAGELAINLYISYCGPLFYSFSLLAVRDQRNSILVLNWITN